MKQGAAIRLGGPIDSSAMDPDVWVKEIRRMGYRASYSPVGELEPLDTLRAFVRAAEGADILIAEVGVWNNPLAADPIERKNAVDTCIRKLALADEIGACCCVNISGSRSARWDGPHPDNYRADTFDEIVQTTRTILDAVKPIRTFYTLEPMPWMLPDSPDSYLKLLKAIDRPRFAVHLDPVNMITSPALYYDTTTFLNECFAKLGPHIKSCHAKDVLLEERYTFHVNETRPGLGVLDYAAFLRHVSRLGPQVPVMLEHLPSAEEYALAADHIRRTAAGIALEA